MHFRRWGEGEKMTGSKKKGYEYVMKNISCGERESSECRGTV